MNKVAFFLECLGYAFSLMLFVIFFFLLCCFVVHFYKNTLIPFVHSLINKKIKKGGNQNG